MVPFAAILALIPKAFPTVPGVGQLTKGRHLGVDFQGGMEVTPHQDMGALDFEQARRDSLDLGREAHRLGWSDVDVRPSHGRMEITSHRPLHTIIPFVVFYTPGYVLVGSQGDVHVFEMTEQHRGEVRAKADRLLSDRLQGWVARAEHDSMSVERFGRDLFRVRVPRYVDIHRLGSIFQAP